MELQQRKNSLPIETAFENQRRLHAQFFWKREIPLIFSGVSRLSESLLEKLRQLQERANFIHEVNTVFANLTTGLPELVTELSVVLTAQVEGDGQQGRVAGRDGCPAEWIHDAQSKLSFFGNVTTILIEAAEVYCHGPGQWERDKISAELSSIHSTIKQLLENFLTGLPSLEDDCMGTGLGNDYDLSYNLRREIGPIIRQRLSLETKRALPPRLSHEDGVFWKLRTALKWVFCSKEEAGALTSSSDNNVTSLQFAEYSSAQIYLDVIKSTWLLNDIWSSQPDKPYISYTNVVIMTTAQVVRAHVRMLYDYIPPDYDQINESASFKLCAAPLDNTAPNVLADRSKSVEMVQTVGLSPPSCPSLSTQFKGRQPDRGYYQHTDTAPQPLFIQIPKHSPHKHQSTRLESPKNSSVIMNQKYSIAFDSHDFNSANNTMNGVALGVLDPPGQALALVPVELPGSPCPDTYFQKVKATTIPKNVVGTLGKISLKDSVYKIPQQGSSTRNQQRIRPTVQTNVLTMSNPSDDRRRPLTHSTLQPDVSSTSKALSFTPSDTFKIVDKPCPHAVPAESLDDLKPGVNEIELLNEELCLEERFSPGFHENIQSIEISPEHEHDRHLRSRVRVFRNYIEEETRIFTEREGTYLYEKTVSPTAEIVPIYAFKDASWDSCDLYLRDHGQQLGLRYRFKCRSPNGSVTASELFGFQGALLESNWEADYQVASISFSLKGSRKVESESYPRIQIWTERAGECLQSPKPSLSASQAELNIRNDELVRAVAASKLFIYSGNAIHVLILSDKIRLDSRSRNSLRIVPDKHCSSVKIRTLKGVRNKPAGIPLGQAGIRFADQHKPGFDDYRYIEIKFNKDENLQDFIGDFKAVMQEWRERCDPIQNFRDLQRNPRIRVKSTTIIDPE